MMCKTLNEDINLQLSNIQKILEKLEQTTSSYASILVSMDGLPVVSASQESINEFEASALAASILSLGEQTTETFKHKKLHRVLVEGEKGITILTEVNQELILITIAPRDAKLGILFMEIERSTKKINKVLTDHVLGA